MPDHLGEFSDTKIAYDLERKKFTQIGVKEEWINNGKLRSGKMIWEPKHKNSKKADPARGFFCCEQLCNSLVVNQGAKNAWYFSRKNNSNIISCNVQNLISNFSKSKKESGKHNLAKEILYEYLNSKRAKQKYKIQMCVIEKTIEFDGNTIIPDITLIKDDGEQLFVEIVNHSAPHKNPNAWNFYKDNTTNLIIVDVKGNEKGWRFELETIREILIEKFERTFYERINIIQLWEDSRKYIEQYHRRSSIHFTEFSNYLSSVSQTLFDWDNNLNTKIEELDKVATKLYAIGSVKSTSKPELLAKFKKIYDTLRWTGNGLGFGHKFSIPRNTKHNIPSSEISSEDLQIEKSKLKSLIPDDCNLQYPRYYIRRKNTKSSQHGLKQAFFDGIVKEKYLGASIEDLKPKWLRVYQYFDDWDVINSLWQFDNSDLINEAKQVIIVFKEKIEELKSKVNERSVIKDQYRRYQFLQHRPLMEKHIADMEKKSSDIVTFAKWIKKDSSWKKRKRKESTLWEYNMAPGISGNPFVDYGISVTIN